MHQQNMYETRYVRILRSMYSAEESAEEDNRSRGGR